MAPTEHTLQSLRENIKKELVGLYPEREIGSITEVLIRYRLNIKGYEAAVRKKEALTPEDADWFSRAIVRLKRSIPVQHITGETEFFGLWLKVGPEALIPRPETEELVQWILEDHLQKHRKGKKPDYKGPPGDSGNRDRHGERTSSRECCRILDIGTGTGCIALALAMNLPDAILYATDSEPQALNLARENAGKLGLRVNFILHDILHEGINDEGHAAVPQGLFKPDLIVSNPPYIPLSEQGALHPNVREHDPPSALFVGDEDPLLYYRHIAGFGSRTLQKGGLLYLEIHEKYGTGVREILEKSEFEEILIKKDINGKDRMIRACRR